MQTLRQTPPFALAGVRGYRDARHAAEAGARALRRQLWGLFSLGGSRCGCGVGVGGGVVRERGRLDDLLRVGVGAQEREFGRGGLRVVIVVVVAFVLVALLEEIFQRHYLWPSGSGGRLVWGLREGGVCVWCLFTMRRTKEFSLS